MRCWNCSPGTSDAPPKMTEEQKRVVATHLMANTSPAGDELTELLNLKHRGLRYSDALQDNIHTLQATLESLIEAKEALDKSLTDITLVLHPVRRLPSEILSHIFSSVACMFPPPTFKQLRKRELQSCLLPTHPAWTLSKVCATWRLVASSTPKLWAEVVLDLDTLTDISKFHLLNVFLSRSREHLLSVSIYEGVGHDIKANFSLALLMGTCGRWKSLSASTTQEFYQVLSDAPATFSQLQNLALDSYEFNGVVREQLLKLRLPSTPTLSLRVFNTSPLRTLDIPYSSLRVDGRRMDIYDPKRQENNIWVLRNSRSCRFFDLKAASCQLGADTDDIQVTSSARTLWLAGVPSHVRDITTRLTVRAPEASLHEVRLNLFGPPMALHELVPVGLPLFGDNAVVSRADYLALFMYNAKKPEVLALKRILAIFSSITQLDLGFSDGTTNVEMSALFSIFTDQQEKVAPRLETLFIGSHTTLYVDDGLLEMLRFRQGTKGFQALKRVIVYGYGGTPENLESLKCSLRAIDGLKFAITKP